MSHYVEQFTAAIVALSGHGHVKQRLIEAFDTHLSEVVVSDLPVSVRESFADLRGAVSRVEPANGEGPICASVRKMSIAEASQCALRLVELYAEVVTSAESREPQRQAPAASTQRLAVPSLLLKSV